MTIADFIIDNTKKLSGVGCDAPRTDVIAILEHQLGQDRSWILAHDDENIKKSDLEALNKLIKQRLDHQPLAYILGYKEFYGRKFGVNPDVLIPRPESESIVELCKDTSCKKFIDIGTGSGCLAITLNLEMPSAKVYATDVSETALLIAQQNCKYLDTKVNFIKSDLLTDIPEKTWTKNTVIITNLPYVPDELITSPEIMTEPKLALFAGPDGLDIYRSFWRQVDKLKNKPKVIITESLENQHMQVAEMAIKTGYINTKTLGLAQKFELNQLA